MTEDDLTVRSRLDMKTLATTHAGDADTLERLARFDNQGQPVLRVYMNLDPSRFPTPHATTASWLGNHGEIAALLRW